MLKFILICESRKCLWFELCSAVRDKSFWNSISGKMDFQYLYY